MAQTEIGNRQIQSVIAGLVAGAGWGQTFIAEDILPPVDTYGENFIYETWDNSGMADVGEARRGLNSETKQIEPPKNSSVSATLEEYALETFIDYRVKHAQEIQDTLRAAFVPADGLSAVDRLRLGRALRLQYGIQIQKEKAAAALVFASGSYDTGNTYGNGLGNAAIDFAATGILNSIYTVKRTVAKAYGFMPDTFVLGYTKFQNLLANPDVLARVTGGANNAQPAEVNFNLLAQLFGVRRFVVGTAITQTPAAAGAVGTATDLWLGTSAALIYTGVGSQQEANAMQGGPSVGNFPNADLASPAFGKTFFMNVPSTGVRYQVQTWNSDNLKLEHLEATEFFRIAQVMKCGAYFTV